MKIETLFTLEDLEKAFRAGRMVVSYKGEREEAYTDDYTSVKYECFKNYYEEIVKKKEVSYA